MRRQWLPARLAVRFIVVYQERASQLPGRCMYEESCSNYALRQLRERGFIRGGWAAFRRYRSCTVAR